MFQGGLVVDPARVLDAILRAVAEIGHAPVRGGHADHRHLQVAALGQRIERGEGHFVGKIARHAEQHQRVRRSRHEVFLSAFELNKFGQPLPGGTSVSRK